MGTLSSPSCGVILSSPSQQPPAQPVGPLPVCSHSFAQHAELHTARRRSEDLRSSLSAWLCSSAPSSPPSPELWLLCPFWIPSSTSSAWLSGLLVPHSAALNLASEPGSEPGQSGGRAFRSHLSGTAVLSCLISSVLKSFF